MDTQTVKSLRTRLRDTEWDLQKYQTEIVQLQAETDRLRHEKMHGIVEMAGAVCHELNQPLQAISGYAELLLMDMEKDHPSYARIQTIKDQVYRIGAITQKLMGINRYETMEYLEGKIIDIDKSVD